MPGPARALAFARHRRCFCRRGLRLGQQRFRLRRRANAKLLVEPAREAAVPAHRRGAIATGDVRDDPQLCDPFVEGSSRSSWLAIRLAGVTRRCEGLLGNSERAVTTEDEIRERSSRSHSSSSGVTRRARRARRFDVVERVGQFARAHSRSPAAGPRQYRSPSSLRRTHGLTIGDNIAGAGQGPQFVQRLAQARLGLLLAPIAPQQVAYAIPRQRGLRQGNESEQGAGLARLGGDVVARRTHQAHGAKQASVRSLVHSKSAL